MVRKILTLLFTAFLLTGCFKDVPSLKDGELAIRVLVKYEENFLSGVGVTLLTDEYDLQPIEKVTDEKGEAVFDNVPYGIYQASVHGEAVVPSYLNPDDFDTLLVTGNLFIEPGSDEVFLDTINTITSGTSPGIKINELYTVGPPNNFFYFYDQYFELYNSSDDTLYLDGMLFCRMGAGLANVTSVFQFPGEPMGGTRDYPIYPHAFVVLASDAYNHRDLIFSGQSSVDLTNADFEFKNPLELNDPDNPDVPNIVNIETGYNRDFMVGLSGDVVLLADGSDLNYHDGIDLESVVDCVEFCSSPEHTKEIADACDRGFGGVGQSKYGGTSLERIAPGFDTNNSTIDFVIIPEPTVGFHHE
jgi:hypothetical protein